MNLRGVIAVFAVLTAVSCGGQDRPVKPETASGQLLPTASRTIQVESPQAFEEAVKNAGPGDQIILADGEWADFDAVLEGEGTAEQPIQLMAETPGKVILTGQSSLRLAGKYLLVSGLVFRDGYTPRSEVISFRRDSDTLAYNSRVTSTVIDNYSNPDRTQRDLWVGLYGKNNTFDFNHLSGKQNAGPTLAVRLNTEDSQENGHRIANNYFGPRPVFGSNGGETLRIGTSHYSLSNSNTLVENNYFDRCSGEVEIISNKSGGNVFRSNTFYASRGTLTLRHGNGTLVENNLFDGNDAPYTGGVRVINAQQTIRNNYFKNLTGNRFSGALVIMNGVPNSPINRYQQVDGAVIENNTFENVSAIEFGEGSDAERTAVPVNSAFRQNVIIGANARTPISLYDDMSGITFSGNLAANPPPAEIAYGFEVKDAPLNAAAKTAGAQGDFGVPRAATGVDWYPKPADVPPFNTGKITQLQPGTDVLSAAIATAGPGDQLLLAPGRYHESTIITVDKALTIKGAGDEHPVLSFERPSMFALTGNGALALDGLTVTGASAPDGSGNSFISTNSSRGSGNHILTLTNVRIEDFDVNRGFSAVSAKKGSFYDRIEVVDSSFQNVSGTVFKLDEETDDYGIYNAEYLTIKNSSFEDIGGPVANIYRGGHDESTFGPHANISGSNFRNVGRGMQPLFVLYGIQQGSFTGNTVDNAEPIALTLTTGLPVFTMSENTISGSRQDRFAKLTDLRNRK